MKYNELKSDIFDDLKKDFINSDKDMNDKFKDYVYKNLPNFSEQYYDGNLQEFYKEAVAEAFIDEVGDLNIKNLYKEDIQNSLYMGVKDYTPETDINSLNKNDLKEILGANLFDLSPEIIESAVDLFDNKINNDIRDMADNKTKGDIIIDEEIEGYILGTYVTEKEVNNIIKEVENDYIENGEFYIYSIEDFNEEDFLIDCVYDDISNIVYNKGYEGDTLETITDIVHDKVMDKFKELGINVDLTVGEITENYDKNIDNLINDVKKDIKEDKTVKDEVSKEWEER